MKLLIVDTVSNDRAPYLKYYEKACKDNYIDHDFFLWDRYNDGGLEKNGNCFLYHKICPYGEGKIRKLFPMFLYRKKLLETIQNNKYTHLILINTLASVMISDYILDHYNKRYIMDIRDYTYERFIYYGNLVNKLIDESYFTTISSKGFYRFLDKKNNIIINHNISNENKQKRSPTLHQRKNVIGFVGSVRYEKENLELIKALKNNSDYELLYCGRVVNGCSIEEKAKRLGVKNIIFTGTFRNSEKYNIYNNIDIINSLYGNSTLEVTTAVPNRYYDALLFKKPIIASKGTYLGELVQEKQLGIVVDIFHDDVVGMLNEYIEKFDSSVFLDCCNKELDQILKEQRYYYLHIVEFLKNHN